MLKPDDQALKTLEARLQIVASNQYVARSLWSTGDTTLWTMSDSGTTFERLKPTAQIEVIESLVDWGLYKDRGLTDAQAGVIFSNVRDGKPPERWLEGIFDEAALSNHKIANFKAMVEDSRNSPDNYFFDEMDGDSRPWADLSAAAKLEYISRYAAFSDVPFEPFAQVVKATIGDMGEAALRVMLDGQKELHAIAKLFPDDGRTEPTPLVERVKDMVDYASALEAQEKDRHQVREKLCEGISDVLDGKPPQGWLDSAKALRDILRGDVARPESSQSQERGGREIS
jgi:hypothetical protein